MSAGGFKTTDGKYGRRGLVPTKTPLLRNKFDQKKCQITVHNIAQNFCGVVGSDMLIRKIFGDFGEIVKIKTIDTKNKKKATVIQFKSPIAANNAVRTENGNFLFGSKVPVRVELSNYEFVKTKEEIKKEKFDKFKSPIFYKIVFPDYELLSDSVKDTMICRANIDRYEKIIGEMDTVLNEFHDFTKEINLKIHDLFWGVKRRRKYTPEDILKSYDRIISTVRLNKDTIYELSIPSTVIFGKNVMTLPENRNMNFPGTMKKLVEEFLSCYNARSINLRGFYVNETQKMKFELFKKLKVLKLNFSFCDFGKLIRFCDKILSDYAKNVTKFHLKPSPQPLRKLEESSWDEKRLNDLEADVRGLLRLICTQTKIINFRFPFISEMSVIALNLLKKNEYLERLELFDIPWQNEIDKILVENKKKRGSY